MFFCGFGEAGLRGEGGAGGPERGGAVLGGYPVLARKSTSPVFF